MGTPNKLTANQVREIRERWKVCPHCGRRPRITSTDAKAYNVDRRMLQYVLAGTVYKRVKEGSREK